MVIYLIGTGSWYQYPVSGIRLYVRLLQIILYLDLSTLLPAAGKHAPVLEGGVRLARPAHPTLPRAQVNHQRHMVRPSDGRIRKGQLITLEIRDLRPGRNVPNYSLFAPSLQRD